MAKKEGGCKFGKLLKRTRGKVKVAVDTDCIISLFKPKEEIHPHMCHIDKMCREGKIELYVSLKTIEQLSVQGGAPLDYAESLSKLPNYPVGTWNEQVGTWDNVAGTWDDAKENQKLQQKIHRLTKSGVNMRDRQIVIDSYYGKMQVLLTNDHGLCDERPARKLREELGILVMSPKKFL